MQTEAPVAEHSTSRRYALYRSADDRVLTGVCGGIAEHFGVSPLLTRFGFALLSTAAGLGIALYCLAYFVSGDGDGIEVERRIVTRRHNVGFALIVLGLMIFARGAGLWFGDQRMWPVSIAILGSVVIFLRDDADRKTGTDSISDIFGSRPSRMRLVAGTALVLTGVATFLAVNNSFALARNVVVTVAAIAAGIMLIFGSWLTRLGRQLLDERRERVRSEERAELGAHLHDSVLHTLALIQRSGSPSEMVALARRQERDLRAWLHGRSMTEEEDLTTAVDAVASRVEEANDVSVDVVVVGNCALDESVRALLAAAQEATMNAARHSGVKKISLYVEVEANAVAAYVRDQGKGFDRSRISVDRRGIAESIEGRMKRHNGTAVITTKEGDGTNVELRIPHSANGRSS